MPADPFILEDAVALLDRTPATLHALLADLPDPWIRATDGDGAWSAFDVVGHLIDGERTNWLVRVRHILSGAPEPFPPFDRTAHLLTNQHRSLATLLTTFADQRRANIAALVALQLTPADLDRTGQHPEFGSVQLRQLLATWVVHDLNHVGQIVQTLAQVYGAAVGPWRAYLPIVQREDPTVS